MADASCESASRERRLHDVIAAYLQASAAGPAPDREALLARHPDLAADLQALFDNLDQFGRWARPPGPAAPAPREGDPREERAKREVPWTGNESLPLSLARRVDAACYRFELAWKAGQQPRIEDYL